MTGSELIAAERERQVSVERWSADHDDEHYDGVLVNAAIAYAINGSPNSPPPQRWPWDAKWWKPSSDPIRNLVKAGALIAAEIDRLQRASAGVV